MDQLTNSQIAERYVRSAYPCLDRWIAFIKKVVPYALQYDSVSCKQLALISQSAMKTFDYISVNDPNASVIKISRMLNDLHDSAWRSWTSFNAQSNVATGSRTLTVNSTTLQGISTFSQWDIALDQSPIFSPPSLLDSILQGVTSV